MPCSDSHILIPQTTTGTVIYKPIIPRIIAFIIHRTFDYEYTGKSSDSQVFRCILNTLVSRNILYKLYVTAITTCIQFWF